MAKPSTSLRLPQVTPACHFASLPFRDTTSPDFLLRLERPQPKPKLCLVARDAVAEVTAITRTWNDGDERLCRLCPAGFCGATQGTCLVLVNELVDSKAASLYAIRGSAAKGGSR